MLPPLLLLLLTAWWWTSRDTAHTDASGGIDRTEATDPAGPPAHLTETADSDDAPRLAGTATGTRQDAQARKTAPAGDGVLRCLVLDPDGEPRMGSVVMLQWVKVAGRPPGVPVIPVVEHSLSPSRQEVGRATTNARGIATFEHLEPGRYAVTALAPPGLIAPVEAVEIAAEPVDVELGYLRAAEARVEVLDPSGQPVEGAFVSIKRGPGRGSETDERGLAVLLDLDPRQDMAIKVRPPRERDLFSKTVDPWTIRDSRITLEASLSLTVQVVDEKGQPVPRARIHVLGDPVSSRPLTTDEEGRYRFRLLRPDECLDLRASPPGGWSTATTETYMIEAERKEAKIVLLSGASLEVRVRGWPSSTPGALLLTMRSDVSVVHEAQVDREGRATFTYLSPRDEFVLWGVVPVDHGERFVYEPHVRVQKGPLLVSIQKGEPIEVRLEVPDGVALWALDASGPGVRRRALPVPEKEGLWRTPPLPPGAWTLHALGTSTSPPPRTWSAETSARAGDRVDLKLEPVEDRPPHLPIIPGRPPFVR